MLAVLGGHLLSGGVALAGFEAPDPSPTLLSGISLSTPRKKVQGGSYVAVEVFFFAG